MQKIMCFLEVEPLRGGQPIDPIKKLFYQRKQIYEKTGKWGGGVPNT